MSWVQCHGQALDFTSESKTVQDRESFDRVKHTDFLARVVLTSVSGVLMTPGPHLRDCLGSGTVPVCGIRTSGGRRIRGYSAAATSDNGRGWESWRLP